MNFVDVNSSNSVLVKLENGLEVRAYPSLPEGKFPVAQLRKNTLFKNKPLGECSGIPFFKVNSIFRNKECYLLTDEGHLIEGYANNRVSSIAIMLLIPLTLILISSLVTSEDSPTFVLPNNTSSLVSSVDGGSSNTNNGTGGVENNSSTSGVNDKSNSDIQSGSLSEASKPSIDYGEVKPGTSSPNEEKIPTKYIPLSWNLTPTLKDGKLRVRFQPDSNSNIKCVFYVKDGEEIIYDSGIIKSGQFIEYASLKTKNISNSTKLKYKVEMLTEDNAIFSEIILPVDKIIVK